MPSFDEISGVRDIRTHCTSAIHPCAERREFWPGFLNRFFGHRFLISVFYKTATQRFLDPMQRTCPQWAYVELPFGRSWDWIGLPAPEYHCASDDHVPVFPNSCSSALMPLRFFSHSILSCVESSTVIAEIPIDANPDAEHATWPLEDFAQLIAFKTNGRTQLISSTKVNSCERNTGK